jgi:hypothetical protein
VADKTKCAGHISADLTVVVYVPYDDNLNKKTVSDVTTQNLDPGSLVEQRGS